MGLAKISILLSRRDLSREP